MVDVCGWVCGPQLVAVWVGVWPSVCRCVDEFADLRWSVCGRLCDPDSKRPSVGGCVGGFAALSWPVYVCVEGGGGGMRRTCVRGALVQCAQLSV